MYMLLISMVPYFLRNEQNILLSRQSYIQSSLHVNTINLHNYRPTSEVVNEPHPQKSARFSTFSLNYVGVNLYKTQGFKFMTLLMIEFYTDWSVPTQDHVLKLYHCSGET